MTTIGRTGIMAACAAVALSGFLCGCINGDTQGNAQAFFDRGTAHFEKREYADAIAAYTKAIAIKPDYADAYYKRALLYYFRLDYDKAWADVKTCRKLGGKVTPGFLAELRKDSGREE